jgi:hypothetical protein
VGILLRTDFTGGFLVGLPLAVVVAFNCAGVHRYRASSYGQRQGTALALAPRTRLELFSVHRDRFHACTADF